MNKGKVKVFKLEKMSILDRLKIFLNELNIGEFSIENKNDVYYITFLDITNFGMRYYLTEDSLIVRINLGNTYRECFKITPNKFLNWAEIYFEEKNEMNIQSFFLFSYYRSFLVKSEREGYTYLGGEFQFLDNDLIFFNIKLQDLKQFSPKKINGYQIIPIRTRGNLDASTSGFFIKKYFYAFGEYTYTTSLGSQLSLTEPYYSKTDDIFYQLITSPNGINDRDLNFIKIKDDYFCYFQIPYYNSFLIAVEPNIEIIEEIEDGRIKTEHYKTLQ